jgi:hypothetical protein
MSTGTISPLTSGYLQSAISSAFQVTNASGNTSVSSLAATGDQSQLSPLAKLLSALQQLQQSDPAKYQQVTQQIATNLNTAAQTANQQGNTAVGSKLAQLATDFTNASQSGQFPNIKDLLQALGGGHHHHQQASADNDGGALNPLTIIQNTLTSAGVSTS